MRPGSRERIATVEEVVKDAARACDPEADSDVVRAFVESFEGDDRPATAVDDLADELRSTARELDPAGLEPAALGTAATAHWLATNPDDRDRPEHAVREGARLFFAGDPPPEVADWLAGRGLS
jgi:hypothetical protein